MIGRTVIVVANLQPAKLMGHESRGMLLAASDANGKLVLVSTSEEIVSGAFVK